MCVRGRKEGIVIIGRYACRKERREMVGRNMKGREREVRDREGDEEGKG